MKKTSMLNLLLAACAALIAMSACGDGKESGSRHPLAFDQAEFRNPGNPYRSAPFWSLNDSLSADEIRRQIHLMNEGGFGGAFLHSRIGLLTPYLGEEWFDMMDVGTKALQELKMEAWYYDEDKWPSGFAGGIVPRQSPDFQARTLVRAPKSQPVVAPDKVLYSDDRYNYIEHVNPMGQPWYNGTSWVDLMNPEMVQAFIDCSYTPYVERFAGQPHVLGIFTDEPQVSPQTYIPHEGRVSFSPWMIEAFKDKWGYDLIPVLPSIFDTVGDWRTVRLHYYRTVAHCMEKAFSKPVADYCAANGFIWTGHYNAEDNPLGNMQNEGNLMQQLRHMQQPGIDALGLRYNTIHCAKVATSVANQYGMPRRLSELFGISGHNMSFEDRMWITAWHTAMGINFMCPHLYLYSMKGARKRDYPPTVSHQQPYWRYNKLFEDYSARLCYFATVGNTVPDVCVLNPIESDYIEYNAGERSNGARDRIYSELLFRIARAQRNFDMGDEQIISEDGAVKAGKFVIGRMAYPLVVVPDMHTIRASTLDLLKEFAAQGGPVLVCGTYPDRVDGVADPSAIADMKTWTTQVTQEALPKAMERALAPRFTVEGAARDSLWSHLREVKGGHLLQLSNASRRDGARVKVKFADTNADVALWNPVSGEALRIVPDAPGVYTLDFAPAQTWVLSTGKPSKAAKFDGDYALPGERTEVLALSNTWTGQRVDPNAITLDYASFSRDGGKSWSVAEPVMAFYRRTAGDKSYNGPLFLKYTVTVDDLPAACKLAMEQPFMYNAITINGQSVKFTSADFYRDHTFRTQDITPLLKKGGNDIVLSLDYASPIPNSYDAIERYGTEIESIYLVGDFGVAGTGALPLQHDTWRNLPKWDLNPKPPVNRYTGFALTREKDTFTGDLAAQGYPFYAGDFRLTNTFELPQVEPGERYLLSFPWFEATLIGVNVNGVDFPVLFASPWEADITSALQSGRNQVTLTLTNSLRNLMGPHHHKGGEFTEVGPATFEGSLSWPNNNVEDGDPDWYDARLRGNATLWRDTYHFIPFGILQPPVLLKEKA